MAEVLANLAALFALVAILGAAFIIGRASNLRATIKDQKERIDALQGLVTTKESELVEERGKIAALEVRFEAVERKAFEYSEIVSGRVDYSALETVIAAYHAELMHALTGIDAALHDIKKLVEARRIGDHSER